MLSKICSWSVRQACFVALLGALVPASLQAQWKPAPAPLMTRWGKEVTPENAWTEYPRPQLVRSEWQNLNGLWDYAIQSRTGSAPEKFDGKILVPFCVESALSGVGKPLLPDQRLWYRRTFNVPSTWAGRRILLHFEAVDFETTVWLNGALLGSHTGGYDTFSFDITDFLKTGDNTVQVSVWDPTDQGEQPRGKQQLDPKGIWYTPVSGIWQTVWLEPVTQPLYLAELRLTPDLDNQRLRVEALANSAIEDDAWGVHVTALAQGQEVASTLMRVNREGWLAIPHPRLWTPDAPFLYDLKAELVRVKSPHAGRGGKGGKAGKPALPRFGASEREAYAGTTVEAKPVDVVQSYFAMRKISIGAGSVNDQPVLLLNNRPLFQHGPLDQGWWPDGLHTPPSDAAMAWDVEWLKKAGFNMLRKHIKVEPARYYYHCDRLGMLVWQDMPSGFNHALRNGRQDDGEPIRLSTSREQHELELRRMLDRLHNFPSIVVWVIHNEGWGQYETAALSQWVKAADSSRVVNAVTGWLDRNVSDIYDIHTYEPTPLAPVAKQDRAIVIGEYGGVGWPIANHLWQPDKRNWGYQTYQNAEDYVKAVRQKIEGVIEMKSSIGLSAAVYTQTTDVEGEVNGFMTYDREVIKVPAERLAEMNRKLTQNR